MTDTLEVQVDRVMADLGLNDRAVAAAIAAGRAGSQAVEGRLDGLRRSATASQRGRYASPVWMRCSLGGVEFLVRVVGP